MSSLKKSAKKSAKIAAVEFYPVDMQAERYAKLVTGESVNHEPKLKSSISGLTAALQSLSLRKSAKKVAPSNGGRKTKRSRSLHKKHQKTKHAKSGHKNKTHKRKQ
jgi:hypothetical protein